MKFHYNNHFAQTKQSVFGMPALQVFDAPDINHQEAYQEFQKTPVAPTLTQSEIDLQDPVTANTRNQAMQLITDAQNGIPVDVPAKWEGSNIPPSVSPLNLNLPLSSQKIELDFDDKDPEDSSLQFEITDPPKNLICFINNGKFFAVPVNLRENESTEQIATKKEKALLEALQNANKEKNEDFRNALANFLGLNPEKASDQDLVNAWKALGFASNKVQPGNGNKTTYKVEIKDVGESSDEEGRIIDFNIIPR